MIPSTRLVFLVAATAPLWLLASFAPQTAPLPVAALVCLLAAGAWDYLRTPGRRQISVSREIPSRFSLESVQAVTLSVANLSPRRVRVEVRDDVPASLSLVSPAGQVVLGAGEASSVRYEVRALQRGPAPFHTVTFRLSHGLGLVGRQFRVPLESVGKVYPGFLKADQYNLLAVADRREEAARIPHHAKGHGSDFESLRPYSPGDDIRRIDWKTTAKRGSLISRTLRVDRGQQLTLLVDAGRFMGESIGGRTRFEHALDAAVMLSSVAQKRGDSVSVACFSNRIDAFLPAVKGSGTVARVLDALYDIHPRNVESDYWHAFSRVLSRLTKRCLIVLFCEVLDRVSSAAMVNSLSRSARTHLVLCVVLTDQRVSAAADRVPSDLRGSYEKAAASHVLLERTRALQDMRSRGILVLEPSPEGMSVQLIHRYLEIRKTNLL